MASWKLWPAAALFCVCTTAWGQAAESAGEKEGESAISFSLVFSQRINFSQNFLNTEGSLSATPMGKYQESPYNLRFENDQMGYSFLLGVGAEARLGGGFTLSGRLDSGEVKCGKLFYYQPRPRCGSAASDPRCGWMSNGREFSEEAASSWFVRELFVSQQLGREDWFVWWAGKKRLSAGDGFVLDNYVMGGGATAQLEELGVPLRFSLVGAFPNGDFTSEGKQSPFVWLEAAYLFDIMEEISLWAAYFHDGDDALAEMVFYSLFDVMMTNGIVPTGYSSSGDFFWVGLSAQKIFSRASLSLTAALELGRADVSLTARRILTGQEFTRAGTLSALGGMADLCFYYDVFDWMTAGVFFLYLSGEGGQRNEVGGSYGAFIGVYSYITRSNIFFSGGMNQNFSARNLSTAGINGRGVLAPGATLGVDITDDILARAVFIGLFSQGKQTDSQSRYLGWEADLNLEWNATAWLSALFEFDYFKTGAFFDFYKPTEAPPELQEYVREPDAWRILLGADISF